MMVPAAENKLQRRTYGKDVHRMMADWADIYGTSEQVGPLIGATMDKYLGVIARKREKGDLSPTTERDYQKYVSSLRPVWGNVRWSDFDAPGIFRWQEARGEQSVVQCNRELTVMSQLVKLAGKLNLIKDNPLRFIDRLKEKPRDRYVTDDEFAAVFMHANSAVRAAMFIASITGLRQGDILRLRRSDFTKDGGLLVPTRKTNQPLLFDASPGLQQAYEMGLSVRTFASLHWLVTEEGKQYTGDGFRSLWHRAMTNAQKASPLKRFTFNDLRAKAGSESRDWQILGHMDQKTFNRVYQRLPRKVAPTR